MTTERWQQIEKLYHAVLDQEASDRAEFLKEACVGDEELHREVEVLLNAHQQAGGFLGSPALEVAAQELAENQPLSWLGRQIGAYQILSLLGAGGMGEVYRAKDTRLNRTVAIKVLPAELSDKADLRQRFEREARVISSLNHPHICALYDIGQQDGVDFLVMEYLEGQTLAERLTKGALPLDQALRYAMEVAAALDLAHRHGVVHRDLKPGNIMLTKSGAKLFDFGLAKLHPGTHAVLTSLSGVTKEAEQKGILTVEGTILGTLPYMAPEQLEGKAADARTDIFAFGVTLYEMITGHPAFRGQSQASLIAAILEHDPAPISTEQPMTPPLLDHVVKRCLRKDPADRWQTAHDLTQELKWIAEAGLQGGGAATTLIRRQSGQRLAWIVATGGILLALAFAAAYFHRTPTELRAMRLTIPLPEGTNFNEESNLDISPDGSHLAFSTIDSTGHIRLWVRALDSLSAQPLPGSDDGYMPFWSPDSRSIGFFAEGKLKKVALSGGSPQTLCNASSGWGGTWNRDGVIVFAPNLYGPLYRVSAAGGESSPVTRLDPSRQEDAHYFPRFLADGRHFLYLVQSTTKQNTGIYAGSLGSKDTRRVLSTEFNVAYASPGYLLFVRDGMLMVQRFDTEGFQLTGEPFPLAQPVGQFVNTCAFFSVSENKVLVYWGGAQSINTQLVWLDRGGKQLKSFGPPGYYRFPSLSPDETRIAVQQLDPQTGKGDIWLFDLLRGTNSRFTFDPADDRSPIWSPDGSRIVFASYREGTCVLYEKSSSGSEEVLLKGNGDICPENWSSDGRFIAYSTTPANNPKNLADLWVLPLFGERRPIAYLQTEFWEMQARFSPDGRWIAYESTESGRPEVYVRSFPASSDKVQVSTQGGADPRWRRDGKELFYVAADQKLMAVEVTTGSTFRPGVPRALFQTYPVSLSDVYKHYTVSKDGQRFLMVAPAEEVSSNPITVVVNWTAELRR